MSCIVALVDGKQRLMGSDSIVISGSDALPLRAQKIYQLSYGVTIGFVGDFRIRDTLIRRLRLPNPNKFKNDEDFLLDGVLPKFVALAAKDPNDKSDTEDDNSWEALIIYKDGIWNIDDTMALLRTSLPYHAIGMGSNYSMGYMFGRYPVNDPEGFVRGALEAAEKFCIGVRGPMQIIKLPTKRK